MGFLIWCIFDKIKNHFWKFCRNVDNTNFDYLNISKLFRIENILRRPTSSEVPKEARVVICGGGAQGAAIAYKLGRLLGLP